MHGAVLPLLLYTFMAWCLGTGIFLTLYTEEHTRTRIYALNITLFDGTSSTYGLCIYK